MKGLVLLDEQPLTAGTVVFGPEPADKDRPAIVGTIAQDGTYTVSIKDNDGIPIGRYRATVFVGRVGKASPDAPFAPRFSSRDSPLVLDVVENPRPGAYDLRLTKN